MRGQRAKYEVLIVGVVVVLSVAISLGIYVGRSRISKEKTMMGELLNMRTAITLYKIINKKSPDDIIDLVEKEFSFGGGASLKYIQSLPLMPDGRIIDPFGNEYLYDNGKSWVGSSTDGYKSW